MAGCFGLFSQGPKRDKVMEFFAHSTERQDRSDWQRLADHLLAVGERAAENAAPFGGQLLASLAGQLHDLGKYTQRFQRRLDGDPARVDHATWGARIACERYGTAGTLLAYGIAGHHAGLADGRPGNVAQSRPSLHERLSEDYRERELPPLLSDWERSCHCRPSWRYRKALLVIRARSVALSSSRSWRE